MLATQSFQNEPATYQSYQPKKVASQPTDDFSLLQQGFTIVQELGQGHFPVYEVCTVVNHKNFVIKTFPFIQNTPDSSYRNETRFMPLNHPNIIHMVCRNDKQESPQPQGGSLVYSYIVIEYAPNGDFFNLIMNYGDYFDDQLVRAFFRHLIEGIEYLQANRVAHLDIKPENLLLGTDFNLKITDFDVSYIEGDQQILSDGTMSYRCPEMYNGRLGNSQLKDPFAADIYSAGIMLFILKSGGVNPYFEDRAEEDIDLWNLMNNSNSEFWREHCELQGKPANFFDQSFIELFNGMTRADPNQRLTIQQIKSSKWYNGPVYNNVDLGRKMKEILSMAPNA